MGWSVVSGHTLKTGCRTGELCVVVVMVVVVVLGYLVMG